MSSVNILGNFRCCSTLAEIYAHLIGEGGVYSDCYKAETSNTEDSY